MVRLTVLVSAVLLASHVQAQDLSWAYPISPPPSPQIDASTPVTVPGSTAQYTLGDVNNLFKVLDWFPTEHPPMPSVPVAMGREPDLRPCGVCHMPNGAGHPESSSIAGQSEAYIIRQMHAFAHDERGNPRSKLMAAGAKAASEAEIAAAAAYYASLPRVNPNRVEEATMVPRTVVGAGAMRLLDPAGGTEPIGQRIIVVPTNGPNDLARDWHEGFISYVPPGSVAKGAALAAEHPRRTGHPVSAATAAGCAAPTLGRTWSASTRSTCSVS